MKILSLIFTILFASFSSSINLTNSVASSSEEVEITIAASEDAHVAAGEYADYNYGLSSPLKVRNHDESNKNNMQAYIKFVIPAGITSISKAIFDIGIQTNGTTKDNNYALFTATNDWVEGSGNINGVEADYTATPDIITYNNAPEVFPAIQTPVTFDVPSGTARDTRYQLDVSALVNNYFATFESTEVNNYITFGINSTVYKGSDIWFQSRNIAGKGPTLTITTGEFDNNEVVENVYDGLTYSSERILNVNKTPVNMFNLEISRNSSLSFYTGTPDDELPLQVGKRASVLEMAQAAEDNGQVVLGGINADFFNASNDEVIQPRGLVIRDGVEYQPEYNGDMFFGVLKNGDPIIGGADEYYANKGNLQMAVGGDIGYLVSDGIACETNSEAGEHDEDNVNPRTAIGITYDGDVIMTVVDGRTADSNGMVLTDLANYMVSKGCYTAINLDGGWSSTMTKKNFDNDSFELCNYPSNGGTPRPIGDCILIVDTNAEVPLKSRVQKFVNDYMHMDDIELTDQGTGLCLGETGYYQVAKAALLELENNYPGAIELFSTDSDFADAYMRFQAWANANNEVFDGEEFNTLKPLSLSVGDDLTNNILVVASGTVIVALIIGYICYLNKKHKNKVQ